jgi:hypothetical protein
VTIAVALGPLTKGETPPWRLAGAFAAVLVAMLLATLVNPYGPNLHLQAVEHVSQASTGRFAEFRSPDFRGGGSAVGAFELFILAVIALGATGSRDTDVGHDGAPRRDAASGARQRAQHEPLRDRRGARRGGRAQPAARDGSCRGSTPAGRRSATRRSARRPGSGRSPS